MPTYHEFDKAEIDATLKTAASHYDLNQLQAAGADGSLADSGHVVVAAAACISVTVEDRKICLKLPLGIGNICIPIPGWIPNGTAAQACIDICTTWGFPTGVEVSVSALGRVIARQSWGRC